MSGRLLILLGTRKGGFVLEANAARDQVDIAGPYGEVMPIGHLTWDPATGSLVAGAGSPWYGLTVWRSPDLGATWTQSSAGLTYGEDGPAVTRVWNVTAANGSLHAGVEPAGLFRSDDGGATWAHVAGLRDHPSRPDWQLGNGGLILHTIVAHPTDPARMWVGISAVGVFETRDGGATWVARNRGVRADHLPDPYPEVGLCVHKFVLHPDRPEVLFQQNHSGVYRSEDGGAPGRTSTPGCRRGSVSRSRSIPATHAPSGRCRSTATTGAGTCPTRLPRSGAAGTPARPGSVTGKGCPSGAPTWGCCGRPSTPRACRTAPGSPERRCQMRRRDHRRRHGGHRQHLDRQPGRGQLVRPRRSLRRRGNLAARLTPPDRSGRGAIPGRSVVRAAWAVPVARSALIR